MDEEEGQAVITRELKESLNSKMIFFSMFNPLKGFTRLVSVQRFSLEKSFTGGGVVCALPKKCAPDEQDLVHHKYESQSLSNLHYYYCQCASYQAVTS